MPRLTPFDALIVLEARGTTVMSRERACDASTRSSDGTRERQNHRDRRLRRQRHAARDNHDLSTARSRRGWVRRAAPSGGGVLASFGSTRELGLNFEPRWFEIFGRVARTGVGERHELTATRPSAVYDVYVFTPGAPDDLRVAAVYQDVSDRKRADERQQLLMRELNHRVKNTLATVQSLANQTLRGSADHAQFSEKFSARLQALSRAHALLTRRNWQSADITDVVRDQLALDGESDRVTLIGPRA